MFLNTGSGGIDIFEVKFAFDMLTLRGQQHSFSTHERVFLWKCQSFWDRKCLDLRLRASSLQALRLVQTWRIIDKVIGETKGWLTITSQGLYSLSGKTSDRKISWSLEAARFGFKLFQSLWNLAGASAALLPRCLSNFRAIRPLQHPITRLREFTRFGGRTSYRLVNRGPDS